MKRVTFSYSAGVCFVVAALLYLVSCQSSADVKPVSSSQTDSTYNHIMDDGDDDPPKQPGGPGCCQ